jgi:hypothetical protein
VAQAVTANYAAASANVVVTRDNTMLRPYLRHLIRATLGQPNPTSKTPPIYGFTRDAPFPLADPDRDLIGSGTDGISLEAIYQGWSHGTGGPWRSFTPLRNSNTPPNSCGSLVNPCPSQVFFNRFVNVVTHEMGHGLSIFATYVSSYPTHGSMPGAGHFNFVNARLYPPLYQYEEHPSVAGDTDLHEPILGSPSTGFGLQSQQSREWLMQWAMFRWNDVPVDINGYYDDAVPPQFFLTFDRPLRFSKISDYSGEDLSIQRFFKERIPVCAAGLRQCR